MSFNIGLSGLRGAQTELGVTGNNLANASTTGFKQSRAEFGDMYASMMGGGLDRPGMGAKTLQISQQHSQGGLDYTERSLDMAIDGNGYFVMNNDGATEYTRAGYFDLDKNGFVINNEGKRLQGFPDGEGGEMTDLQVSVGLIPQQTTTEAEVEINLDSRSEAIAAFDIADPSTTSHFSRSLDIYDSLGEKRTLTQYFTMTDKGAAGENTWEVNFVGKDANGDNVAVGAAAPLIFNPQGQLQSVNGQAIRDADGNLDDAAEANAVFNLAEGDLGNLSDNGTFGAEGINVNLFGMTQYGAGSSVLSLGQNGYSAGSLAGLSVNDEGWVTGRYTNGENINIGRVGVATFVNPQGLESIGSTAWTATQASGEAAVNPSGVGRSGQVIGGALEQSTVDVSEELVKMIVAQRNYQANAKTIQTQDTLNQTIINLR